MEKLGDALFSSTAQVCPAVWLQRKKTVETAAPHPDRGGPVRAPEVLRYHSIPTFKASTKSYLFSPMPLSPKVRSLSKAEFNLL